MKKLMKQVGAGAASLALVFALAGTALAVTYATVDGHEAFTNENNKAEYWGEDCEKLEGPGFSDIDSYELTANYGRVIVKSGSGEFANTIFDDVVAGETVWADTNGDGVYNVGGKDGDKQISHIIFCDETETTTSTTDTFTSSQASTTDSSTSSTSTETTETTDTFTDSVSDSTTQPPTDTIGAGSTGQQSGGLWMLLAALGVLAGSVIVLAPSKAKNRD